MSVVSVTIRCDVCGRLAVTKPRSQEHHIGVTDVSVDPPTGWKLSHGDSGRRCFHRCPGACSKPFSEGGTGLD